MLQHVRLFSLALVTLVPALAVGQPDAGSPPVTSPVPGSTPSAETTQEPTTTAAPVAAEPAQHPAEPAPPTTAAPTTTAAAHGDKKVPWYEKLTIRGYAQLRYNRLYATEDGFKNDLGDKNIADGNSFSLRRARLVVSGDVTPFLSVYTQGEFTGSSAKMRDWYADVFADRQKQFRVRLGQQKIPYGFENMQSSQNRAPLDRSDGINSAVPGERDLGAIAYWETPAVRKRFKHLVDSGLKGSGDYGIAALGVYNGQGINVDDVNGSPHVVARVTYPFVLGSQILEVGASGYVGKFVVARDAGILGDEAIRDMRVGGAITLYPQPIGFQAEYNVGKGPELVGDTVRAENLHGGYAMVLAKVGGVVPFVRGAYYDGGIKTETNAPHHELKELAVGTEWQMHDRIELTAEVDHAKRTIGDASVWGTVVRLQAQFNY